MSRWKRIMRRSLGPGLITVLAEAERVRGRLERPNSRASQILTDMTVEALKDAYSRRKPVVWISLLAPPEIVLAAGAVPFSPESVTATIAWMGLDDVCLLESERLGLSPAVCASHRTTVGAVSLELLPFPDALVCTTDQCSANLNAFVNAAERFNKPLFTLDIPAERDQSAKAYVAFQLGQMVQFMTETVKTNFGRDGLVSTIENSNRARESLVRLNELRKVVSLPKGEAIGLNSATPHFGRLELADFLDVLCHEAANSPKVAGSPRLLWLTTKPYASPLVIEKISRQGASIVFEEANQVYWPELDPGRPLSGLAEKTVSHYARASVEERVDSLLTLADEYQVDGVIASSYPGCRYGATAIPYILTRLSRSGIPALSVDEDDVPGARKEDASPLDEFLETLKGAA
ncbi:MAG: 2-hydroxyacyl-CoA dehydratase [Candidatus Aquicultorales bacterium]